MFWAYCEGKENKTLVNSSKKKLCHKITSLEQISRLFKNFIGLIDDLKSFIMYPLKFK